MALWECDGCGFTGGEGEVHDHVIKAGTLADGAPKDPEDITCWGGMEVGSQVWTDYHVYGIHPMTHLIGFVQEVVNEVFGPDWEVVTGLPKPKEDE